MREMPKSLDATQQAAKDTAYKNDKARLVALAVRKTNIHQYLQDIYRV